MKKTIFSLILLVMILALAACQGSTSDAAPNGAGGSPDGEAPEMEMSTEMTLVLGTVKLDETDYAIDAEQAAELLPLWKAYLSLSDSDTVAQAELDALVDQLEESFTPEQTKAIDAMDLSMQDMNGVMATLGVETSMGGFGGGAMDADMQETMEAARASGDFAGGGPGGDMGGMGGGPGGDMGGMGGGPGGDMGGAGTDSSDQNAAAGRGGGFGINTTLLDAIVEFLEAKIQ